MLVLLGSITGVNGFFYDVVNRVLFANVVDVASGNIRLNLRYGKSPIKYLKAEECDARKASLQQLAWLKKQVFNIALPLLIKAYNFKLDAIA